MKKHIFILAVCFIILSSCSVFKKTQNKQLSSNEENEELIIEEANAIESDGGSLLPPPPPPPPSSSSTTATASFSIAERYKSLAKTDRIDYGIMINKVVEFRGKLYLILHSSTLFCNELWEFDGDTTFKKLIDYSDFEAMEAQGKSELKFDTGNEYGNSVRGISSLAVANNKLYLSFSNGRISNRLFRYSFTQGPLVIDGVTKVFHLTAWDNFGLVYSAMADNDAEGLFTVDENGNAKLLTECNTFYLNFIRDGVPYGRSHSLPVIDSSLCIISNGCPYILKQNGEYISWKLPEIFRVERWAKLENGVFIVDNLYGTFLRIEDDCKTIKDASALPEYMHVYKIDDDIKSIDNTVYFNAKSASLESKVLYYKNERVFGDVTESFNDNGIKVKELITSFQENLIMGKLLEIEGHYITALQSYNPKTNELKDITFSNEPMEIDRNSVAFQHNGYLYFVGNSTEKENCLWRYDGINDPELIEFKNTSK